MKQFDIPFPWLLDGGLSNELESQGHNLNDKLWSARLLIDNPEAITKAHIAYLNAGAQCIITSSYQATIPGFLAMGLTELESENLLLKTVTLAEDAIRLMEPKSYKPLIAASIGPYGAYLANGAEYTGYYNLTDEALHGFHKRKIEILDQSNADFFACETIPSFREAKILAKILQETKKPSWISFSCKDNWHTNDGSTIGACAKYLLKFKSVFAIGVNCTKPVYVSGLIKHIKEFEWNKRIVVYPNSGQKYNEQTKTWSGFNATKHCEFMAKEWLEMGADIIGGCCGVGPGDIKAIGIAMQES
jgi:homocysteine S-methyltransferase